tara:strand:+ start:600 stop:1109 length:510 start_codon:yes stop_codon:yes gene_type:complete
MKVPYTNFKTFVNGEWKEVDTEEIFSDKKIIILAVPGAFTSEKSDKQVQEYENAYETLKKKGIDEVFCTSVNDTFVMNAWFEKIGIKQVKVLADGEGVFAQGMGMLVNKPRQGFGMRSWRYSALVDDGEVKNILEEPGKNNSSDDDDPKGRSNVANVLKYMERSSRKRY